jgi:hypothetical protein
MPPVFRFALQKRVVVRHLQAVGTIINQYRNPLRGVNIYIVRIDEGQPVMVVDGLYTAFESELSLISETQSGDHDNVPEES